MAGGSFEPDTPLRRERRRRVERRETGGLEVRDAVAGAVHERLVQLLQPASHGGGEARDLAATVAGRPAEADVEEERRLADERVHGVAAVRRLVRADSRRDRSEEHT